jgi:hypothetical protein
MALECAIKLAIIDPDCFLSTKSFNKKAGFNDDNNDNDNDKNNNDILFEKKSVLIQDYGFCVMLVINLFFF